MKQPIDSKWPYMPATRRDLYFRVINDYADLHAITHRLHFLNEYFPPDKIDLALKWLVAHHIIGRHFVAWFKTECKNSDLEMHRLLLAIANNEEVGRVIAGKNFVI